MKFKLQGFGIKESQYERPNQPWICGRSATGEPCRIGPDAKGQCGATYECAPILKEGRWQCTRPSLYGGSCENGPLPAGTCALPIPKCQPVRSLRAKRRLLAVWASVVTIGLLAFALGSSRRDELLSPGDLGFRHGGTQSVAPPAALLRLPRTSRTTPGQDDSHATKTSLKTRAKMKETDNPSGGQLCGDCHAAKRGPLGWLAAPFGASSVQAQSQLCLRCHVLGENALSAHSRPPTVLALATSRIAGASPAALPQRSWECATCHIEHKGRNFPIAFLENRRCQACHARTFASLASGHPEFSGYPHKLGSQLKFDHNKHKSEYFFKTRNNTADRPFECRGCHVPDSSSGKMLVRGFDQTCAACHAAQIGDNEGIPFLSVPGFDPKLNRSKAKIGEWPNHFETDFSPFMRLLLTGGEEKEKAAYLQDLKGVDLLDLGNATNEELEAVQAYAWGVKRLFADLSLSGHEALQLRFKNALYGKDSGTLAVDLTGEVPPATVHSARRGWFPHLLDEVRSIQTGGAPPAARFLEKVAEPPNIVPQGKEPLKWVESGGWYRNDRDFTVRYRPARHADAFLRAWLDVTASLKDTVGARRVLETLSQPTSPGRCMKCHTLGPAREAETQALTMASSGTGGGASGKDEEIKGPAIVRWTSQRSGPNERAFTKFVHSTHLMVMGQANSCSNCHLLAADAPGEIQQSELMAKSVGDFVPMQKARCLTCHMGKAAGDNCVLCHNYHVGVFATTLTAAPTSVAAAPSAASKLR